MQSRHCIWLLWYHVLSSWGIAFSSVKWACLITALLHFWDELITVTDTLSLILSEQSTQQMAARNTVVTFMMVPPKWDGYPKFSPGYGGRGFLRKEEGLYQSPMADPHFTMAAIHEVGRSILISPRHQPSFCKVENQGSKTPV